MNKGGMTGVPNSSSQASSSVAQQAAAPRNFDVGSENELLQLLNFIRRGPFLPDQKNILRDVVLDFALSKDPAVLGVVASALARNNATLTRAGEPLLGDQSAPPTEPTPEEAAQPAVPEPETADIQTPTGFGGGRPQPVFGQAAPQQAAPEPVASQSANAMPEPAKAVPVTSADPKPAPSVAGQRDALETKTQTPPLSEETPTPEPATAPEPVAQTVPTGDPMTRIKEIKTLVNKKVGNPVNLIDSNNQVGREYMNALLGAMKSANGGTHEESQLAMQRLEKAYAAVESSFESGEITAPTPTPTPQPEPTPEPEPAALESMSVPTTPSEPEPAPPTPEPQQTKEAPTPASPEEPDVLASPAPTLPKESATPETFASTESVAAPEPAETPGPALAPEPQPAAVPGQSLAARVTAERAERAETAEKNAAERQAEKALLTNDPLQAEEVSRGLGQLLSEWKLFKSSGIFGTGPNGYDHPLFKAMAPLPMAAVIAGRFEGANPEVRQSISDYMSGWRYEQGVVHEMNESFEHYLRRVVHKILEKQPK